MRSFAKRSAPCDRCKQVRPLWQSFYRVLDFGVPGMPPLEFTGDLGLPSLCDECELVRRMADPEDPMYVGK